MYYQLSNTAGIQTIEQETGLPFKYPNLYYRQPIINGLEESVVPVITMSNGEKINFAIWGILPENYQKDWAVFQNAYNTLTLEKECCLESDRWYSRAFEERRCLVIATGFFTYYLHRGDLYPYYVHARSNKPLTLGGIYNQLEDGFLTCAIILTSANDSIKKVQNLDRGMPMVVDRISRNDWLNKATPKKQVIDFICRTPVTELLAHPISKEFFDMDATNESILEPVHYNELH